MQHIRGGVSFCRSGTRRERQREGPCRPDAGGGRANREEAAGGGGVFSRIRFICAEAKTVGAAGNRGL